MPFTMASAVHLADFRSKVDLYRSDCGDKVVVDVRQICFNDVAIRGIGAPGGGFVWPRVDQDVIFRDDPAFRDALRASDLMAPEGGCNGHFRPYLDPEILLNRRTYRRLKQEAEAPQKGSRGAEASAF
jgi:hypothetical protein